MLDLSDVTRCDTAGIQLLISAKRTAEEAGKGFLISEISEAVLETAKCIGVELNPL